MYGPSLLDVVNALGGSGREIAKALTGSVNAGTDLSQLTGAGALRVENLDPVLFSVTVENKHFDLFNRLLPNKRESFSLLDQQIIKKGTGGFPGSAVSTETATGRPERQGDYERLLTQLGVFADYRNVGVVTGIQGLLQQQAGATNFSTVAEENVNAALTLLETVEWSCFYADRGVNDLEINGLLAQINAAQATSTVQNLIDLRGGYFTDHEQIAKLAANIARRPQFGQADLLYTSTACKGDLDNCLISGYRVNLDSAVPNTVTGVPMKGIRYSAAGIGEGYMDLVPHAYIEEDKLPVCVQAPNSVGPQGPPAAVAASAANLTSSMFVASQSGNYYYAVEACQPGQVSALTFIPAAVAVSAGEAVTLAITPSAANTETDYRIYRGRLNGTNQPDDVRLIARVAKATNGTTTFVDYNQVIPGTSEAFMLTSAPQKRALTWIQMLPLTQYPLAQTDLSIRWAVLLLGALRIPDARKHGVITNILPKNAAWRPFNV
jgi:hypothetical protein